MLTFKTPRSNLDHSSWRRTTACLLLGTAIGSASIANGQEADQNKDQPELQTTQSNTESTSQPEDKALTPSITVSNETPLEPSETQKPSALESAEQMIERSVMPITNWVEKKIQGTNIIKPSPYRSNKNQQDAPEPNGITMRQAIVQAMDSYPGTVLSSEKTQSNGHQAYQIKILSKQGVIRIIEVSAHNSQPKNLQPKE